MCGAASLQCRLHGKVHFVRGAVPPIKVKVLGQLGHVGRTISHKVLHSMIRERKGLDSRATDFHSVHLLVQHLGEDGLQMIRGGGIFDWEDAVQSVLQVDPVANPVEVYVQKLPAVRGRPRVGAQR